MITYEGGAILSLDAAKRTGVAYGRPGEVPELSFVDFAREHDDAHDVFGRGVKWMARFCAEHPEIELLVIEGTVPQYDKTLQSGLWGILTGIAVAKNIRVMVAPIRTWRTVILGQGNLDGKTAKARAVEVCGLLGWTVPPAGPRTKQLDHNAAEAGAIWLWACSIVAPKVAQRVPFFMKVTAPKAKARNVASIF